MWKFSKWSIKTKWIVTFVVALLITIGLIGSYNSPPVINVADAKNNTISTDNSEYALEGNVSSLKDATLTINGRPVVLSESHEFLHNIQLKEGDNIVDLVAVNENGKTEEAITIHRTTQAELMARTEAEKLAAKEKAEKENKKIAEAEAKKDAKAKSGSDKKSGSSWRWPSFKWPFGKSDEEKAKDQAEKDRIAKEEAEAEAKKPKHSFEDFYKWVNSYVRSIDGSELQMWAYIDSRCDKYKTDSDGGKDLYFDKSCLQEGYKEYIKPSGFDYGSSKINDKSICPASDEKYYMWVCSRYGDMLQHIRASWSYGASFKGHEEQTKAEAIYKEIARTKG